MAGWSETRDTAKNDGLSHLHCQRYGGMSDRELLCKLPIVYNSLVVGMYGVQRIPCSTSFPITGPAGCMIVLIVCLLCFVCERARGWSSGCFFGCSGESCSRRRGNMAAQVFAALSVLRSGDEEQQVSVSCRRSMFPTRTFPRRSISSIPCGFSQAGLLRRTPRMLCKHFALQRSFVLSFTAASMRRERRWWTLHRSLEDQSGFWECERPLWHRLCASQQAAGKEDAADMLDQKYLSNFRVDYTTWQFLVATLAHRLERESTNFRSPISGEKRLAIGMFFLAHGSTFQAIATTFRIGTATAFKIVHQCIDIMKVSIVPAAIKFPHGPELQRVIASFRGKHRLPLCAGALDGTFIIMKKPALWGDTYWCYKNRIAILMLGVCDDKGLFTHVDVGRAGSVGDAFAFNHSRLKDRLDADTWLHEYEEDIDGILVKPYLIADSAFPLSPKVMKNYDRLAHQHQRVFNRALTSSRQIIENAFGSLKGRWHVLTDNFIRDPAFIRDIALVCTALNNVCERSQCPYDTSWAITAPTYRWVGPRRPPVPAADMSRASEIRFAIASSL